MNTFLLALLLAADWITIIPTVERSIVRLEAQKAGGQSTCTAVLFEIDKETQMAAAFTAAHCVDKQPNERLDLTVSGRTAYVVDSNKILDIAIVRYRPRSGEQPIAIAKELPVKGTPVMVVGYPWGVAELAEQFGHISQSTNRESKFTWVDITLIFGDSGGGLVNDQGELVGINSSIYSQGPARMGAVVSVDQIQDYIDVYRQRFTKAGQQP